MQSKDTRECKGSQLWVATGTFLNLKPFYIHNTSLKDMEMCCCKLHLHIRWCIKGILECAKKLEIRRTPSDYKSFYDIFDTDCEGADNTYISWECTPDKKKICAHTLPCTHFQNKLRYDAKCHQQRRRL